jgi:hypothetical protein
MRKGEMFSTIVLSVLIIFTFAFLILILPNMLYGWQSVNQALGLRPPMTVQVVIKPEHIPLTADHTLFSLLASTDTTTGLQVQDLLAYASFYGNKQFKINGVDVDVNQIVSQKMNFLTDKSYYILVAKTYGNSIIEFGNPRLTFDFTQKLEACGSTSILTTLGPVANYKSMSTLTLPNLDRAYVVLYLG